jgi:hypothetical protein
MKLYHSHNYRLEDGTARPMRLRECSRPVVLLGD